MRLSRQSAVVKIPVRVSETEVRECLEGKDGKEQKSECSLATQGSCNAEWKESAGRDGSWSIIKGARAGLWPVAHDVDRGGREVQHFVLYVGRHVVDTENFSVKKI